MNDEKKEEVDNSITDKIKDYFKNLVDFSNFDTKTILYIILVVILLAVSFYLVYILIFVDPTILYRVVIEWFVNPIYLLGVWGILLFIGVMAIQGLLIPIPSEIVLLATGMIWGVLGGGVMGIIGSVAAGMLCFYISRKGGRPLAEKFVGETAIHTADKFIHKYGIGAILVARFLPFIAFDPISYASGLVDLDAKKYTFGTFVGSIPRAFFYSYLGATLGIVPPIDLGTFDPSIIEAQSATFNSILIIIAIVLLLMFGSYYVVTYLLDKRAKKISD